MEIDWSKAPAEATHKVAGGCWYKVEGDSVQFFKEHGALSPRCHISEYSNCWSDFIPRPIGLITYDLPAIGTHVIVVDDGSLVYGHGESGEVLAHVDGCAVIRMSYGLGCFLPRLLRKPESAAEEKQKWCRDTLLECGHLHPSLELSLLAQSMYDKGYRKTTAQ